MSENNNEVTGTEVEGTPEVAPSTVLTLTDENVAKIVNDPTEFGFEWITNESANGVGKNRKILRLDSPEPKFTDVTKFRAAFGDAIVLDSMNGSSIVVRAQGVARKMFEKNVTAKVEDVKSAIVRRVLLGERTKSATIVKTVTVEVVKTVYPDGKEYATLLEYQQSMIAQYIDMGLTIEQGKKLLGIATE